MNSHDTETLIYTLNQQKVLSIIPHVSGTLSVLASLTILVIIWNDRKIKLKRVYHRLLGAMSIMDVMVSFNQALSSLVVPRGTPGVYNALGTVGTCAASGFVNQFNASLVAYGAFLAVYFILIIVFRMKESFIARRIEPFVHLFAYGYPFILGVTGLVRGYFKPLNISVGWCNINGNADGIELFQLLAILAVALPSAIVLIISMVIVYVKVRMLERRIVHRYFRGANDSFRQSKDVGSQAALYIGSSFLVYTWQFIVIVSKKDHTMENQSYYFGLAVMIKIFLPLQGLFSLLIYIRPRYNALRMKHPEAEPSSLLRFIIQPRQYSIPLTTPVRPIAAPVVMRAQLTHAATNIVFVDELVTAANTVERGNEEVLKDDFAPELDRSSTIEPDGDMEGTVLDENSSNEWSREPFHESATTAPKIACKSQRQLPVDENRRATPGTIVVLPMPCNDTLERHPLLGVEYAASQRSFHWTRTCRNWQVVSHPSCQRT